MNPPKIEVGPVLNERAEWNQPRIVCRHAGEPHGLQEVRHVRAFPCPEAPCVEFSLSNGETGILEMWTTWQLPPEAAKRLAWQILAAVDATEGRDYDQYQQEQYGNTEP